MLPREYRSSNIHLTTQNRIDFIMMDSGILYCSVFFSDAINICVFKNKELIQMKYMTIFFPDYRDKIQNMVLELWGNLCSENGLYLMCVVFFKQWLKMHTTCFVMIKKRRKINSPTHRNIARPAIRNGDVIFKPTNVLA